LPQPLGHRPGLSPLHADPALPVTRAWPDGRAPTT
jgi:hypothetical protein